MAGHAWRACNQQDEYIVSEPFSTFLPRNLTLQSFLKDGETAGPEEFSAFILRLLPSRTGLTMTARLDALPLGIRQPPVKEGFRRRMDTGEDGGQETYAALFGETLSEFAVIALHGGTLMDKALAQENCDGVSAGDLQNAVVMAEQQERERAVDHPDLQAKGVPNAKDYTLERFRADFRYALGIYRAVGKQAWRDIILEWNEESGRFTIQKPANPIPKMTFREFLRRMEYYAPVC